MSRAYLAELAETGSGPRFRARLRARGATRAAYSGRTPRRTPSRDRRLGRPCSDCTHDLRCPPRRRCAILVDDDTQADPLVAPPDTMHTDMHGANRRFAANGTTTLRLRTAPGIVPWDRITSSSSVGARHGGKLRGCIESWKLWAPRRAKRSDFGERWCLWHSYTRRPKGSIRARSSEYASNEAWWSGLSGNLWLQATPADFRPPFWANLARFWPNLAEFGRDRSDLGPNSARILPHGRVFGRIWSESAKHPAKSGRA